MKQLTAFFAAAIVIASGLACGAGALLPSSEKTWSLSAMASQAAIAGPATAKDGDDVIVGGIDIRLQGIAAPEDNARAHEPGGPEATASMHAIVDGKSLECRPDGTKARGRPVAICFLPDGRDVGELQVLSGHARDCPHFSNGRYAGAEAKARAAGHNISAIYSLPSYCGDQ